MVTFILSPLILSICLTLLSAPWASAQTVAPSNSTANTTTEFIMATTISGMETKTNVNPLTDDAGLTRGMSQLERINPRGPLVRTTDKNVGFLDPGYIVYISCEPSDYTGNIDAAGVIDLAVVHTPNAIVLYSEFAASCTFSPSGDFNYSYMYTMLNASSSAAIVAGLQRNNPPYPETSIQVDRTSINGTGTGNDATGPNLGNRSPTTAVAMIILYSITGIITALFLIIIVVGAIRAHRHPERYGPRRVIGRARQSRAKGIARAMLETLPIVKFGDDKEEVTKPAERGRDVELASVAGADTASGSEQPTHAEAPLGGGPDIVTTEAADGSNEETMDAANATDNGLACSVCTDDFVKGQDIRVLPCKHKFHPECIDPWLLNVSGTCPLCRVDLHPTNSHSSVPGEDEPPDVGSVVISGSRANTTETTRRNRRSRILHTLNIGHMRQATPDERIAALRRLRDENQETDTNIDQGGRAVEERTMNRLGARLSRALGGSRPNSGIHSSRPTSYIPPPADVSTSIVAPERRVIR